MHQLDIFDTPRTVDDPRTDELREADAEIDDDFDEPIERDGFDVRPLPSSPTKAEPGSDDKLLALMRRFENGESLWHADDRVKGPLLPPQEEDGEDDDNDDIL